MKIAISFAIFVVLGAFDEAFAKDYYIQPTPLNWYAAFESCAAQGLQLASIASQEDQTDLETAMAAAGVLEEIFWISGNDLAEEGVFRWHSTGEAFSFTKWGAGQPDNHLYSEHCVHVRPTPDAIGNTWNDAPCISELAYICEDKICDDEENSGCGKNNCSCCKNDCGCGKNDCGCGKNDCGCGKKNCNCGNNGGGHNLISGLLNKIF